jgi:hypothetical protein
MRDNLARQRAAYLKAHGAEMPPAVQAHALATMLALQSLYFEDAPLASEARGELSDAAYWRALVPSASADPEALRAALALAAAERAAAGAAPALPLLAASVQEQGFSVAEPQPRAAARVAALCATLALILAQLQRAALPPHFVFVYNAPWELLAEHWVGAAAAALGEDSVMEADMSCWALQRPASGCGGGAPPGPYVGANFGASHRDQRYSACHAPSGAPSAVNVWTPFNACGARADNGAMRVLPIPADAFFFSPEHPAHLDTAASLREEGAEAAVRVLACGAGAACVWVPSLVHWGGACAADAEGQPRASLAVTFRAAGAPRSDFGGASASASPSPSASADGGPPPMLLAHLDALPLQRRLAYVAKGLLAYSHWHAGFPGVHLGK